MENGGACSVPDKPSEKQRIEQAKDYKNDGNKFHKEGNLNKAIGKYHRALLQLKGIGISKEDILFGGSSKGSNISDEVRMEISKIQLDCYNNLAASILKQDEPNYEKMIHYCNEVLSLDPTNEKALFRKGTALNKVDKFDESVKTLEPLAKDFSLLRKPLATAREGQRLQSEKLKKNLHGMFESK